MLVSEAINEIRIELDDLLSTRWTDATLITLIKKAVRRLAGILYANDIGVGKKTYTFSTVNGTQAYALPTDFMADVGVFRQDTLAPILRVADFQWEILPTTTGESLYYIVRTQSLGSPAADVAAILLKGTPASAISMKLVYWPRLDSLTFTTSTQLPYNGMFDDMLLEYVTMRCKNIDEMTITTDAQLLQEMESRIVSAYGSVAVKKDSPTQATSSAG